jgi:hypothetical protein
VPAAAAAATTAAVAAAFAADAPAVEPAAEAPAVAAAAVAAEAPEEVPAAVTADVIPAVQVCLMRLTRCRSVSSVRAATAVASGACGSALQLLGAGVAVQGSLHIRNRQGHTVLCVLLQLAIPLVTPVCTLRMYITTFC